MNRRSYSFPYREDTDPATPVLEIGISLLQQQEATAQLTAFIDSGADITLLPLETLEAIGAKPIDKVRIRGILGFSQPTNLYLLCLYIWSHLLPAIQVAAIHSHADCLLGRNVLNRLEIILNGPAAMTEILV